jgi:hypothetical protein
MITGPVKQGEKGTTITQSHGKTRNPGPKVYGQKKKLQRISAMKTWYLTEPGIYYSAQGRSWPRYLGFCFTYIHTNLYTFPLHHNSYKRSQSFLFFSVGITKATRGQEQVSIMGQARGEILKQMDK